MRTTYGAPVLDLRQGYSWLVSLRLARRVGVAERLRQQGRMFESDEVLREILQAVWNNGWLELTNPGIVGVVSAALIGHCRCAHAAEQHADARHTAVQWRPFVETALAMETLDLGLREQLEWVRGVASDAPSA